MHVNLNHMRQFVVVAEELHFGRAAARLHIAQPPLSQQIRSLERELNVELFSRKNKRVQLTAAGEVFLVRCKQILLDLNDGVLQAQRAHRGEVGSLVVGFIPTGMNELFTSILPAFRERHPDIQLTVRSLSTTAQLDALRNGELDVGVLRLPVTDSRIEIRSVFRESLMVALSSTHRLASRRSIALADIASEPQISFPRQLAPEYHAFLEGLFESIGATFKTYQEAEQFSVHLGLIAGGLGIGLVPGSSGLKHDGVVFRKLLNPEVHIETGVAVLRGRQAPLIEELLAIAGMASALNGGQVP